MFKGAVVLLKNLFKATILKKFSTDEDDKRWVAGFYNRANVYKMIIISPDDIIEEGEQFDKVRNRKNKLNKILKKKKK